MIRCRVLGHRWVGPPLISAISGHTTRYCGRCKRRVLIFMGHRYSIYG